jgi:hypothetical protein
MSVHKQTNSNHFRERNILLKFITFTDYKKYLIFLGDIPSVTYM